MKKFDYDATYFNPLHTLGCGQIFRFYPDGGGYTVFSADKMCRVESDGVKTVVESDDCDYFYGFFDLDRDYSAIVENAKSYGIPLLTRSAEKYRGLRLLNQNREEMIFSFIISQNNNIPRIKGIISRICDGLGEERTAGGINYRAFPTAQAIASAPAGFLKGAGAGYRDVYLTGTAEKLVTCGVESFENLSAEELRAKLMSFKGIGGKVADCISLFGFSKRNSFPVDTWIEKAYREDMEGTLKDRNKISAYLSGLFGENSGYIQQYLFYGKRTNL